MSIVAVLPSGQQQGTVAVASFGGGGGAVNGIRAIAERLAGHTHDFNSIGRWLDSSRLTKIVTTVVKCETDATSQLIKHDVVFQFQNIPSAVTRPETMLPMASIRLLGRCIEEDTGHRFVSGRFMPVAEQVPPYRLRVTLSFEESYGESTFSLAKSSALATGGEEEEGEGEEEEGDEEGPKSSSSFFHSIWGPFKAIGRARAERAEKARQARLADVVLRRNLILRTFAAKRNNSLTFDQSIGAHDGIACMRAFCRSSAIPPVDMSFIDGTSPTGQDQVFEAQWRFPSDITLDLLSFLSIVEPKTYQPCYNLGSGMFVMCVKPSESTMALFDAGLRNLAKCKDEPQVTDDCDILHVSVDQQQALFGDE